MKRTSFNSWWGPPKKLSTKFEDRKISWLELFYDLVYVIAVSRITHYLSGHLSFSGLLDYIYIFGMVFWGWYNGSFYHDLHGSSGLRTNLMTLWQMIIVSALIVTLSSPPATLIYNVTIALVVMQVFITYLWWSVGIYDDAHRKLNRPYTICFLISLALIVLSFFLSTPYVRPLFYLSLLLNYLPPFLIIKYSKEKANQFSLSSSMTERLGLFTIILFGEVVAGTINSVSGIKELTFQIWVNFGLTMLIVFAAWWIFFTMIADKKCKQGYFKGYLMTLIYIPTLMSLGMIGVTFGRMFQEFENSGDNYSYWIKISFGVSLSLFLFGIVIISQLLDYSAELIVLKKKWQQLLFTAAVLFFLFTMLNISLSLCIYLVIVFMVLLTAILLISKGLLAINMSKTNLSD